MFQCLEYFTVSFSLTDLISIIILLRIYVLSGGAFPKAEHFERFNQEMYSYFSNSDNGSAYYSNVVARVMFTLC